MSDPQTQNEAILTRNDEFDADDDDDPLNQSHRVAPMDHQILSTETEERSNAFVTTPAATTPMVPSNHFQYDLEKIFKTDKDTYLHAPIPMDHIGFVTCRIIRHSGLWPTFNLYFQGANDNDLTFLLTARKHFVLNGHSEYYIGVDETMTKNLNDGNSVALLKAMNIVSSEYVLFDQRFCATHPHNKEQLAAILYDERLFGSKEPRKLTVLLRDAKKPIDSGKEPETLINQWKSGLKRDFIEMKNRTPDYNRQTEKHSIHFIGNRIKLPSHKNFQLCVFTPENHEESIVMQFGRIDENNFALDYRYPLTAVQAFGIALSSFHNQFRS